MSETYPPCEGTPVNGRSPGGRQEHRSGKRRSQQAHLPQGGRRGRLRGRQPRRAPAVRHARRQVRTRRSASPTTCPARRRSWSSPTGRPTSTRPTKKAEEHPRRTSRRPPASSVDYTDDVSDNAEFFAKVRNQLGGCEPIGRDMMVLTDWMAAKMIGLGWVQPLRRRQGAQPAQEPDQAAAGPSVGQGPHLLGAVAERPDRHRLQRQADQGGRAASRSCSPAPTSRARSPCSPRCATRWRSCSRSSGPTRTSSPTPSGRRRSRSCDKAVKAGQVRAFTGNEYIQDLTAGNIVACEAWSGDVIQAQFDNPDIKFVVPEEGLSLWSDNMLVPNKADPPGQRREVDRLLLRARGRGEARGLRQLHLPGRGRPRRDGEDRRHPRRQPADLPLRGRPEGHVRLHGARRRSSRRSTKESFPMSQVAEAPTASGRRRRSTGCGCAA